MLVLWCAICTELMEEDDHICTTLCGHIYHHQCLEPWIRRSQSCPSCRKPVTETSMSRVFPSSPGKGTASGVSGGGSLDTSTLTEENELLSASVLSMNLQVEKTKQEALARDRVKDEEIRRLQAKVNEQELQVQTARENEEITKLLLASVQEELSARNSDVDLLQAQLQSMESHAQENITLIESLRWDTETVKNELMSAKQHATNLQEHLSFSKRKLNKLKMDNLFLTSKLEQTDLLGELNSAKNELANAQRTLIDLEQQVDGYTKKTNKLRESNRHLVQRLQEFARAVKTTAAERKVDSSFVIYDHQEKLALEVVERLACRADVSAQDNNDVVMRLDHALLNPMENNMELTEVLSAWNSDATVGSFYPSQYYYKGFYSSRPIYGIAEHKNNEKNDDVGQNAATSLSAVQSTHKVVPIAPEAVPTASDAVPTASDAVPTAPEAVPTASDAVPTASEAVPTAPEAVPTTSEVVPFAPETVPTASKAVSTASDAVLTAPEVVPLAPEVVPFAPKAVPTASEAVPTALETVPTAPEIVPFAPEAVPTAPDAVLKASKAVPTTPEAVSTTPESVPTAPEAVPNAPEAVSTLVPTPRPRSIQVQRIDHATLAATTLKPGQTAPEAVSTTPESVPTAPEAVPNAPEAVSTLVPIPRPRSIQVQRIDHATLAATTLKAVPTAPEAVSTTPESVPTAPEAVPNAPEAVSTLVPTPRPDLFRCSARITPQ